MKLRARLRPKTLKQTVTIAVVSGFLLGVFWLVTLRFVTYTSSNVHYHANFALYINGQRDELNNFTFYEEVQSCGSDQVNDPRTRVHLHNMVNSVVHVHDNAGTWGHLFANLGYTLGDDLIKTDDGAFVDVQGDNKLTFLLNGESVEGVANRTIRSQDALLISYGNESADILDQRYGGIIRDAGDYNNRSDPGSCAGTEPSSFLERLKIAVGLD